MARVTPTGWDGAKYREIKIDHSLIDSDLSDFPIAIHGDATSIGKTSVDVSSIFDEIGANWQKIAIANEAGSQCYVEKVGWDTTGETLELWFKAPSVSSSSDSKYYLYYDNDHADNTTYVKAQGSATDVWDSNFKLVAHMNDLTTSTIEDSTSNSYDGAKYSANSPIDATGKIGDAQNFDGSDDYITSGDVCDITGALTVEAWINSDNSTPAQNLGVVSKYTMGDNQRSYALSVTTGNKLHAVVSDDGTTNSGHYNTVTGTTNIAGSLKHVMLVYTPSTSLTLYVNGTQDAQNTTSIVSAIHSGSAPLWIGVQSIISSVTNTRFDGIIDEVRVVSAELSAAYAKASYNSGNDSLITFGSEGTAGGTEAISINTLLQKASTSFLGYDSVIQKSFSGDVVLNAILRIIGTSSVSADSLIMATLENNINIDSLLRSTGSSVVDLNTILYLIRTGNISVDAILKVIGSQTTSLGSIIKKVYSSSLSADSVVAIGNSVYVSASALLEAAMLENVNIDLLLRSVKTEYITLNGLLLAAKQNNLSIDSLIMAVNNINVELNSIISKLYYSGADIDAILSSGVSAAMVYTDSLIAAMYSEHALLDAYLSYSTPTPVVYLDSIIALYQSGYISLNALIMASKSVQVSVDALIASGISNNVLIDLIVSSISSGVVSMDSLLRNELSNTTSIDALLGIFTKILFDVVLEEAGYVLPYHSIIEVGSRTRNINVPTRTRII